MDNQRRRFGGVLATIIAVVCIAVTLVKLYPEQFETFKDQITSAVGMVQSQPTR